jgi:hypothetical protein
MDSIQRTRLRYGFAITAIVCSVVSLLVLLEFGGTRWTTSLNAAALVLVLLAMHVPSRGEEK